MDNNGSTLERLQQQLADLESAQRATGGAACPEFWKSPAPDAVDPGSPDAAGSGSPDAASPDPAPGHGAGDAGDAGAAKGRRGSPGFRLPFTLDWSSFTAVPGRLAPTFAFAAGITRLPDLPATALEEADLLESVTQLGALQHHKEVNLVRLVTELEARGVASPGGLSRVDWLRSVDPTLTANAAKAITTCAAAFTQPRWAQLRDAVIGGAPGEAPVAPDAGAATGADPADGDGDGDGGAGNDGAGDSVPAGSADSAGSGPGRVTVGKAAQVIDFHTRLKPVADPDELEQAITHLTDHAAGLRWETLAKLARELSDQIRPPKDADDLEKKRRNARGLWFTPPNAAGMVAMTGTLDPEGAAIIKSAIDPLAAPCPLTDEGGRKIEDDPRPAHQRRMDALIEIIGRGVSSPGGAPTTDKAKIVVTINFDALREWVQHGCPPDWNPTTGTSGASASTGGGPGQSQGQSQGRGRGAGGGGTGRGSGSCLTGDVLTPATVRRLACDAAIIPVVLGSDSQPLDVGREDRLVTRAMRTALWIRDQGCSFPGCSMPAQWTDAHHVTHWIDGGATAVSNLALLCRRHHAYLHDNHLTATITTTDVTWHTWQHWRTQSTTGPPDPPPSPDP